VQEESYKIVRDDEGDANDPEETGQYVEHERLTEPDEEDGLIEPQRTDDDTDADELDLPSTILKYSYSQLVPGGIISLWHYAATDAMVFKQIFNVAVQKIAHFDIS
jgi:hypothetical protein